MNQISAEKEKKNIHNAICHFTLFNLGEIEDDLFKKILDFIDVSNITDREFFSNEKIRRLVNYERISKKQLIRLIIRDPEILNKVNIEKFRFKIKELQYFLKMFPEYIDIFNLDFGKVDGDEFLILMEINQNYANQIDFEKVDFAKYQLSELIKKFHHRPLIINKALECNKIVNQLDNFQIRQLILYSGENYIQNLDLSKLNDLDWFEIIKQKPELLTYCNTEIFEKNDCYMLVRLFRYAPNLEPLIISNKQKISNLGWEKLLQYDFEKFYPLCCFECLDYKTRKMFLHKLEPR